MWGKLDATVLSASASAFERLLTYAQHLHVLF
jgi:hypothetical protein